MFMTVPEEIMRSLSILVLGLALGAGHGVSADDPPAKKSAREALRPLNDLIGSWRAVGTPAGTKEEQEKGLWNENMTWEWKFKGADAWITVTFKEGKHFTAGEVRYDPAKDRFVLTLKTPGKETLTFTGSFTKEKVLTLEREEKAETQRLVITLLHANRFLYRLDAKPAGKMLFTQRYKVGATKEGEAFAVGDG